MSTIKVDTIATRTGSGNITLSNNVASLTVSGAFTSQGIDDNANNTAIAIDTNEDFTITKQGTNTTDIRLANSSNSFGGNIKYDHNVGNMIFHVHNGERIRFRADGGICFNGDTAAENALDDYEEGTWTPILGGNTTYNNQQGIYRKIGKLCFIRGDVHINALGTGSPNTLSGLPFSGNYQGTPQGAVNVMYYSNIAQNYLWMSGYVLNNATSLYFSGNTSAATTIQLNSASVFGNNARVLFSATYVTD